MLDIAQAEQFLAFVAEKRIAADVDALADCFHADAMFRIIGVVEPVIGKEAIRDTLRSLVDTYEFVEWRRIKTFVDKDEIAVRQHLKVRHRGSGKVVETETCEFLTVKDGKCTAFVQFADTALIHQLAQA